MKRLSHWRESVAFVALCGVLAVAAFYVYLFATTFWKSLGDLVSDRGYYGADRQRHLAHGYEHKMEKNLSQLQQALVSYCQQHKGNFPPMQTFSQTREALRPYAQRETFYFNPTTHKAYQPNIALHGRKYREVGTLENVLAFYDDQPPETYPEVYYVTLSGRVGHVAAKDWLKLKGAFLGHIAKSAEVNRKNL